MPKKEDKAVSDQSDLVDLAADVSLARLVRVATPQDPRSERREVEGRLARGATYVLVTDDPTLSSEALAAKLAEVGLELPLDRTLSVLVASPRAREAERSDVWERNAPLIDERGV